MNTLNDTTTKPVIEATQAGKKESKTEEAISDTSTPSPTTDSSTVILDLENMIKTNMTTIDSRRNELKKNKEMLSDILGNDPGYKEASDKAKEANKVKAAAKAQVMRAPNAMALSEKVRSLAAEVKESEEALSDYLREYERLSGSNEIEGDDGEVREIVYVARLIKKSSIYQK